MVVFDLPTYTKAERDEAASFRKRLKELGFTMFQYSIYMRHCATKEKAEVQIRKIKSSLPESGHIGILHITDRQWGLTEIYTNSRPQSPKSPPGQLEFF